MIRPWLIVAGDFVPWGGMDRANVGLAARLASVGHEVHVVTHRACGTLKRCGVLVHPAARPLGSHAIGMPFLAREAARRARELRARGVRVVANGGNFLPATIAWVHYVHAAYEPVPGGTPIRRALAAAQRRYVLEREREGLAAARLVICNSERTRRDVGDRLGIPEARTRVVYYGTDPERFALVSEEERTQARRELGLDGIGPVALFAGALGDRRKGFDALFDAWLSFTRGRRRDAVLLVAGEGRELPTWIARAEREGLGGSMRFLGFRRDIPRVLAAVDLVIHPARYEAYGLSVHEAACRGIPAIVSAQAGVTERLPASLRDLFVPEIAADAVLAALERWCRSREAFHGAARQAAGLLAQRTWDAMADEIAAFGEAC